LDVTFVKQNAEAKDCISACIFMCLSYLNKKYDINTIKDSETFPSNYTEIYDLVEYRENTGVEVDNEWCERLNKKINNIEFELKYRITIKDLKNKIKQDLPLIAIYEYSMIFPGRPPKGNTDHAGVIIGFDSEYIILLDPHYSRRELPVDIFIERINRNHKDEDPIIISINIIK